MKVLIFIVILLIVSFTVFFRQTGNFVVINWQEYSGSETGIEGYLFGLTNPGVDHTVYLSVDSEIDSKNIKLADGWSAKLVSRKELWNPRVCAKMPLTLTDDGDIFMYETERLAAGMFAQKLIWFNSESKESKESQIKLERFIGRHLFVGKNSLPHFFSLENSVITKNIINVKSSQLEKVSLVTLAEYETVTLELNEINSPMFKIYNSEKFESKVFKQDNNKLVPVDELPPFSVFKKVDETYVVYNIGNDFEAQYRPGSPYETSVLYQGKPVASFIPEMKVYSYIIGSY